MKIIQVIFAACLTIFTTVCLIAESKKTVHKGPPDLCKDASIDAITETDDKSVYVFKGDYYWKLHNGGLAEFYPRNITEDWGGIPGNVDAAFLWLNNRTYIFKGPIYWRFHNRCLDEGFPLIIKKGYAKFIPNDVDAAFMWNKNQKEYFLKGDEYWLFLENYEDKPENYTEKPLKINDERSTWKGVPDNIDAVLSRQGMTYFFKGKSFYGFNDTTEQIDPSYPRKTATEFFGCPKKKTKHCRRKKKKKKKHCRKKKTSSVPKVV